MTPTMRPAPGERLQRFVGDHVVFEIAAPAGKAAARGWRAMLRTNLGRADLLRGEILGAHAREMALAGVSWRDIGMHYSGEGWRLELPLAEPGYYRAKAYLLDEKGWQHWPTGADIGISVHPDNCRTANVLYCAFPRLFGSTKTALKSQLPVEAMQKLDEAGFSVLPPSGKLRDLKRELPHIFGNLGCQILHLLPVNPTPTTYARFGRYGSPYASLDLRGVDLALVEFDKRTTGIDQFRELTYEAHLLGGRVFLDIVINHTGWGSVLQENHPDWFLRQGDGAFVSPGAWGVTWEDLVELNDLNVALWDELAETFLVWCRRGVDGFRCDAGYMVPVPAWQYIIARVRQEYPESVFLLEGLGGAWEATEALLTEGGMQWAYSELFQNYSCAQISGYLDHTWKQSRRVGVLVHYSETHDNDRLAAKGRAWSLLRNRLCALASVSGGFGFTCGVEWLAAEKIRVHGCAGLAWGSPDNIIPELAALNRLLAEHPCFFDGATVVRLSPEGSPIQSWLRTSADQGARALVLVNTDLGNEHTLRLPLSKDLAGVDSWTDLLTNKPAPTAPGAGEVIFRLAGGGAMCLSSTPVVAGYGEDYRRARAQAAWGLQAISQAFGAGEIGNLEWRELAREVDLSPERFLAKVSHLANEPSPAEASPKPFLERLRAVPAEDVYPRVVVWTLRDARRAVPVPPGHWLLIQDSVRFRAALDSGNGPVKNVRSIAIAGGEVACFPPRETPANATLSIERYAATDQHVQGAVVFLGELPDAGHPLKPRATDLVLLTNGRGAMARLGVDLGRVQSKYDCVLGANLHPDLPVDRHIFAKRMRVWVNADGFLSPLDFRNLAGFEAGPPARWHFVANAGDGRTVEIQVIASMLEGSNTTVFHFVRPTAEQAVGKQLPPSADVRLTVRVDIEDRSFHSETKRNGGADYHFSANTRAAGAGRTGFEFVPAADRRLRVTASSGTYHPEPEWSENLGHPLEQSRGQVGSGDAYSPGWFELPLAKGAEIRLVLTAEAEDPVPETVASFASQFRPKQDKEQASFPEVLARALNAFVVRRGTGKTVIAGYPWFLDWGRDTFICARGLLAAGMIEVVERIVVTFAGLERQGTLPNTVFGEDASNRDTSDAPLWFGVVCEELAQLRGSDSDKVFQQVVDRSGRTLSEVLQSIAAHFTAGTPNGIRVDAASGLVWSPSHFTWMDTNYPAGTPRQGYPVEIQCLWIRLLRLVARLSTGKDQQKWEELGRKAAASLDSMFWREEQGYYADVLLAEAGQPASRAVPDDAIRSNCLLAISLGIVTGNRARRCVLTARQHLLVPGGLRSLAPLGVSVPLPIYGPGGRLLNDPHQPYWGHYEGDEDTRRKPAYHNGTAWTWTLPSFCEAMARAWGFHPAALAAARAYLGSMAALLNEGCLGHLPEILDGDAPHTQRGCDAQAWAVSEALRVWRILSAPNR